MKREGLSMRTRTKLAPKLPAAYENQVLEFHSYVTNFKRLTTLSCPKLPMWLGPHSQLMCHLTELCTSKEQRPWLLKLVVVRKHISLLFYPAVQMGQCYTHDQLYKKNISVRKDSEWSYCPHA